MSGYQTTQQLIKKQLSAPANYRTSYDKKFNNFYDSKSYNAKMGPQHSQDASGLDVSENFVENYYLSTGQVINNSKAVNESHRSSYDKKFNNFYNSKSFNAKTGPQHSQDASGLDVSENFVDTQSPSYVPPPGMGAHHPGMGAHHPGMGAHHPGMGGPGNPFVMGVQHSQDASGNHIDQCVDQCVNKCTQSHSVSNTVNYDDEDASQVPEPSMMIPPMARERYRRINR